MKSRVTVFTPTYNRAHIIEQLYHSLQRQTCVDFEWLVVDDGSTDNTKELFECWSKECQTFEIRYYQQENKGKCQAINLGLDFAKGKLFFTVDSDDYLTNDAIEKIIEWEKSIPKNEKYCGFAGNLGTSINETPNNIFDEPYVDGNALDRYKKIDGERAMVFYTETHRQYKYPYFPGENFMTEAVTWNRMAADGYKMRFFNDIIWVYEYQPDGLTRSGNSIFLKNPKGYGLWMKEKAEFEGASWKERVKMYYTFTSDLFGKLLSKEIASCIGAPKILIKCFCAFRKIKSILKKSIK